MKAASSAVRSSSTSALARADGPQRSEVRRKIGSLVARVLHGGGLGDLLSRMGLRRPSESAVTRDVGAVATGLAATAGQSVRQPPRDDLRGALTSAGYSVGDLGHGRPNKIWRRVDGVDQHVATLTFMRTTGSSHDIGFALTSRGKYLDGLRQLVDGTLARHGLTVAHYDRDP